MYLPSQLGLSQPRMYNKALRIYREETSERLEQLRGLVQRAADTIVWLDLPKPIVMRRVVRRTVSRAVRREELWNGNREPLTNFYRWDPEQNIIRWAWANFDVYRRRYEEHLVDGTWAHAEVARLRSPGEVAAWLAACDA